MLPSHTVPPAFLCPSAPAKPSRTRALLHCQLSPNTLPPCPPPPADYDNRILTHDRAMRAGLDDVGLGALFGLYDYKYEVGGCWGSAGQQQQHGRHSWLWHIHAHVIHLSACAITITTGAMTPIPLLPAGAGPADACQSPGAGVWGGPTHPFGATHAPRRRLRCECAASPAPPAGDEDRFECLPACLLACSHHVAVKFCPPGSYSSPRN